MGQTSRSLRNRTKNTIATNPSSPGRAPARVRRSGRIRYAFDNSMSRGTPALVAWLGAASLVLILSFATVITILWWFYLQSVITLLGAQLNVVLTERLHPRGLRGSPDTEADQRAYDAYAKERTYQEEEHVEAEFRE